MNTVYIGWEKYRRAAPRSEKYDNLHNEHLYKGSEVLTAVVMKSSIFWDVTPCSLLEVNRRFGGTCRLRLQCRRISQAKSQRGSRWQAEPTLKKKATCSSETSVDFQWTTRSYLSGGIILHIYGFLYAFYVPHLPFIVPIILRSFIALAGLWSGIHLFL
jgi:hypothetical protein